MSTQVMTTFMPPPPAATFLAFHPQDNNIIAIGMEDSTIQIYNVRVDEVCFLASSLCDLLYHYLSRCTVKIVDDVSNIMFCTGEEQAEGSSEENHGLGILQFPQCACIIRGGCSGTHIVIIRMQALVWSIQYPQACKQALVVPWAAKVFF